MTKILFFFVVFIVYSVNAPAQNTLTTSGDLDKAAKKYFSDGLITKPNQEQVKKDLPHLIQKYVQATKQAAQENSLKPYSSVVVANTPMARFLVWLTHDGQSLKPSRGGRDCCLCRSSNIGGFIK